MHNYEPIKGFPSAGQTTMAASARLELALASWPFVIAFPNGSHISECARFILSEQIGVCSTSFPTDRHWTGVTATMAIELARLHSSAVLYFSQSTDARKRPSDSSFFPLKAAEEGRFCSATQKSFGRLGTFRKSRSSPGMTSTGKAMERSLDLFEQTNRRRQKFWTPRVG